MELELDETTQVIVMEIARMVLSGMLGQNICIETLDQLDISDEEANRIWVKLERAMAA